MQNLTYSSNKYMTKYCAAFNWFPTTLLFPSRNKFPLRVSKLMMQAISNFQRKQLCQSLPNRLHQKQLIFNLPRLQERIISMLHKSMNNSTKRWYQTFITNFSTNFCQIMANRFPQKRAIFNLPKLQEQIKLQEQTTDMLAYKSRNGSIKRWYQTFSINFSTNFCQIMANRLQQKREMINLPRLQERIINQLAYKSRNSSIKRRYQTMINCFAKTKMPRKSPNEIEHAIIDQ